MSESQAENTGMNGWATTTLGTVLGPNGYIRGPFGSSLLRNEMKTEGIPVYEQQHAIYNHRHFRFYIDEQKHRELKRFTVKENDLIISCSGTLGKVSIIKKDDPKGIISQALLILRPELNNIDIKFLYYFLTSPVGFNSIVSVSSGSVQTNIAKRSVIENTDILLPPLPEQRAIAGMLSSLDDKIDLLNRQNKTLESMAEALWRKMFVEEADSGWQKGKLGDEMDITMGQSPPGNTYNEDGQGMIFFQGRAEFGFRFPEVRLYCSSPKRIARQYDTLVSVRAPVGDINIAYQDCCIGRGLAAVRHKRGHQSYAFYKVRSLKDDFESFEHQGTVFGSIGKDDFNNLETIIPSNTAIENFDNIVNPIDNKIFQTTVQIRTLSRLRDTLLSKLMSGEVTVKYD